jgi:hypothetical protein
MISSFRHIIVVFLVFAFLPLLSQEKTMTEDEIFSKEIDSLMTQIADGFHLLPESSVKLVMNENPQNKYFHQAIVSSLLKHNIVRYGLNASTDTTLEINIRKLSVHFGDVFSNSFFGPKLVERTVVISLQATYRTAEKYYSLPILPSTSVDTVSYAAVKSSDVMGVPLTSYSSPSVSWFDSFLEPVIVTVAAGVAVYLFFTIRS